MKKPVAVAVATSLLLLPLSPTHAEDKRRCKDRARWSYSESRIVAAFTIDLSKCWSQKQHYKVHAWIERNDPTSPTTSKREKSKTCAPDKLCRIRVRMDHPSSELATYRLSVEYLETPNHAVVVHRGLVCKSSPAAARCTQI